MAASWHQHISVAASSWHSDDGVNISMAASWQRGVSAAEGYGMAHHRGNISSKSAAGMNIARAYGDISVAASSA